MQRIKIIIIFENKIYSLMWEIIIKKEYKNLKYIVSIFFVSSFPIHLSWTVSTITFAQKKVYFTKSLTAK